MISTGIDDWLEDEYLHRARWEAWLSDGTHVFMDDYRPGVEPHSAWERLGVHCKENGLYIVDMIIRFRSHVESMGQNKDGYFFCKGVTASLGKSLETFLTGTLDDGILVVQKWLVPSLTREKFLDDTDEQVRSVDDAGLCLIRKPECLRNTLPLQHPE